MLKPGSRRQEFHLGPEHLGHMLLLFPGHQRGTGSEVEQPGLNPAHTGIDGVLASLRQLYPDRGWHWRTVGNMCFEAPDYLMFVS